MATVVGIDSSHGLRIEAHHNIYVTGFVKVDPNHTGTEIHFIAEH